MMDHRRANRPVPLPEALNAVLRTRGLLEASQEELCAFLWREAAGEWYGRHTHVTSMRDGILNVRCDSAPRAQQLQLDAPEIIRRLNERLGDEVVREIRPSSAGVGARREPAGAELEEPSFPTEEELAAVEVPPEEIQAILECVSRFEGELRHRLEEMMLLQARVRAWQSRHGWWRCPGCGSYDRGPREYCLACRPPAPPSNAGGEEGLSAFFETDAL
ncbi:MAG: DUF721 domain-containing protein [Armatimonadota bacterium]